MSHGLETLDQQSAPESTRGLFDTYNEKPKLPQASISTDRHRSLDVTGRNRQSLGPPPSTRSVNNNNNNGTRIQNRSRSASTSDMGYFGNNRRSNGALQPLREEGGPLQDSNNIINSKMLNSLNARESVTVDSLKDIINTLKTLPPTSSVSSSLSSSGKNSNNNNNSNGSKRYSHRKQASMSSLPFDQQQHQQFNPRRSYNDNNNNDNMHSILLQNNNNNNGIIKEEDSNFDIKPQKSFSSSRPTTITFRPRHSFGNFATTNNNNNNNNSNYNNNGNYNNNNNGSNSGSDDDMGRDAALAEAEAKLVGSFNGNNQSTTTISSSTTGRAGRRRYSDSSSHPPLTLHKRTSLQQLATLNEESASNMNNGPLLQHHFTSSRSSSALSKRTQFNKPLDLFGNNSNNNNNTDDKVKSLNHSRRSSRNMDMDWRSSLPAIPAQPTSPRSSFQLVPFTPTRVNFSRDDANPHQRRPLFIAHLPFSSLTPLFRQRQLVRGMLRVNKRNRSDAYVFCEELDADIYIAGSRDRNRALEGDVVAVRLVDVDKVLQEKREKEEAKLARNAGQVRARLPDEEDENEIIFGGDDEVEIVKPKYCGVIVAILERAQNQLFSGTLTLIRPNNKRAQEEKDHLLNGTSVGKKEVPRIVWFKASDKRVPLIAIPIEQAPKDFVENSEKYATRLFAGSIKRWPITSLHPFGTLEKELGSVFDLKTQTSAIYADNNVTDSDFSEAVYNCLPPEPFEPSASDASITSSRRDFTKVRCFTIDPKNSNVMDDAISIEKLDDDLYEIGVHISDVTYFIKPHSALDKEARTRGVRVDLLHSHVPMVPETLTEKMTNLIPGHTRFTFSVVWKMNSHGKVSDTWYGKTLIRSCAQLTMDDAQHVINGGTLENVTEDYRNEIENDIRLLNNIAAELFNHRTLIGTLTQMKDELVFDFDTDYTPQQVSIVNKPILSHQIVKEFLLLANKSVAQKISSRLPEQALLRRHASPIDRKIRALQQYCVKHLGVQIDIGSAGNLGNSIQAIKDTKLRKLVSSLVLKTVNSPKYFCAGTYDIAKYSHYALNVPLFTHFTAPSRRFSDIIVHRQLEYALNNENDDTTPFYLDRDTVQKLAQHCNVKKEASRYAREQSSLLFLSNHINGLEKQIGKSAVYREATVVAVFDDSFDVMIHELNMEKRIHLANLPVWRSDFNECKQTLTMFWRKGVDTSTGKQRPWSLSDDEEDEDDDQYLDEELLLEEMRQANLSDDDNNNNQQSSAVSNENELNNDNEIQKNNNNNNTDTETSTDQQQSKDNNDRHNDSNNNKKMNSDNGETNLENTVKELSILEKHGKNVKIPNNNNNNQHQENNGPQPSLTVSRQRPESTKSTGKRASLVRARLSDSTAYSTEQGYQTIKALDKIRVVLVIDMVRTPPLMRILGVNPFA